MEKSNCTIFCLYGSCVDSYIDGIFHGMRVESTAKTYQHGIPYRVYGVSTGNHWECIPPGGQDLCASSNKAFYVTLNEFCNNREKNCTLFLAVYFLNRVCFIKSIRPILCDILTRIITNKLLFLKKIQHHPQL